ncbi:MAG: hypothetical protein E6J45_02230 [Chloroflexi bacterium]|nr:MAG: hypothetical protein E6J45_02230 [Chloroflexota bacterium]
MAKKTRRQKQRAAARRPAASSPGSTGLQARTPAPGRPVHEAVTALDESAARVEAAPAVSSAAAGTRRRIERVSPVASGARPAARPGRGPANAAAMFQPLESEDAAIPFDRVPYVPSDLRRVGVMAALMVVLIIVAALIVSHVVT